MPGSVSLVVPRFNHAANLPRAILSGLRQSRLLEIIIVDDCSRDNSLTVAQLLAGQDGRVRVVASECNGGLAAARNLGALRARGRYLAFLDADDELIVDYFPAALDLMEAHPGMCVVKPDQEFFDPCKGIILQSFDPRYRAAVLSSVTGLLIEREVFGALGGFPEDAAFRGHNGGEDVAFMEAVKGHCQPIGRIDWPCYRVWSQAGSHVDNFLANTRLTQDGFEFVRLDPDQMPSSQLSLVMSDYLARVAERWTNVIVDKSVHVDHGSPLCGSRTESTS